MKLRHRVKAAWRLLSGRYEGAQQTPYRSQIPGSLQSARLDASASTREVLGRKARYFERNSALVNRLADLFETYVVGTGIQFFPVSSDAEWNARAAAYLEAWKPFADLSSLQGFDTLQGIIARALLVDGEIFVVLTQGESGFPRIQLVESHRCATPPDRVGSEGKTIVDGVEIDPNGRPTGYWFSENDDSFRWLWPGVEPAKPNALTWRQVPAESVVHVFEPGRTGQFRGLTMLYPVMNDLHDLDDLQLLEMKAARDAAEVTNVLKNEAGMLTTEELMALGGVPTTSTTTAETKIWMDQTVGGRNVVLRKGDEFAQFRAERPSALTRDYWDVLRGKVCQGVGIPIQIVDPTSQQGTTFRAAVDASASWFHCRFAALAVHLRRVVEYVLGFGIRTSVALADPPADWRNIQARPPRSLCVDLGYAAQARVLELAAGLTTLETLHAEHGRDWRHELTQRATELRFIEDLAEANDLEPEQISAISLPDPPPTVAESPEPELEEEPAIPPRNGGAA